LNFPTGPLQFPKICPDVSAFGEIELLTVAISVSRRMIPFPSGSCLSKLERVKANSNAVVKIIDDYHFPAV